METTFKTNVAKIQKRNILSSWNGQRRGSIIYSVLVKTLFMAVLRVIAQSPAHFPQLGSGVRFPLVDAFFVLLTEKQLCLLGNKQQ